MRSSSRPNKYSRNEERYKKEIHNKTIFQYVECIVKGLSLTPKRCRKNEKLKQPNTLNAVIEKASVTTTLKERERKESKDFHFSIELFKEMTCKLSSLAFSSILCTSYGSILCIMLYFAKHKARKELYTDEQRMGFA